jgi:hypothetical protein
VDALCTADDLLSTNEHIKAVAVGGVIWAWHGVERPDLQEIGNITTHRYVNEYQAST